MHSTGVVSRSITATREGARWPHEDPQTRAQIERAIGCPVQQAAYSVETSRVEVSKEERLAQQEVNERALLAMIRERGDAATERVFMLPRLMPASYVYSHCRRKPVRGANVKVTWSADGTSTSSGSTRHSAEDFDRRVAAGEATTATLPSQCRLLQAHGLQDHATNAPQVGVVCGLLCQPCGTCSTPFCVVRHHSEAAPRQPSV